MYRKITYWYGRLLSWLLAFSVAILIFPVSMQIFSRYTELIPSYIWTEEMARFFLVWTVMIGAMLGVRESRHFEVDMWPILRPRADAALRLVADLAVLAFALVFVCAGYEFTAFAWNRISELAQLPLWMIPIAWPLTGATWLIFNGEQMWDNARTLLSGKPADRSASEPTPGSAV